MRIVNSIKILIIWSLIISTPALAIINQLFDKPPLLSNNVLSALDSGAIIGVRPADQDFTIVLFPDTQNEVQLYPSFWEAMAQWCVDNKTGNNIQAVIGLGDVTNNNNAAEYREALVGWNNIKKADIPYIPLIGNHDYPDFTPKSRDTANWNTYFGIEYFVARNWFGAALNNKTENYYVKLNISSHKYLILCLECFPLPATLEWARGVLNANTDRETIVATHSYLDNDGQRSLPTSPYGTVAFQVDSGAMSGQQLWDNFVKQYKNIFLVVCGHYICNPTSAYSSDTGINGNVVHQLFFDHQCEENGGNGYLVLLNFRPSLGRIEVTTYSPTLNAYDSTGAYTLVYKNSSCLWTKTIVSSIMSLLLE